MKSLPGKREFSLKNERSLAQLQRYANFVYIDRYTGSQGKQFKLFFKQPAFLRLLQKYQHPPVKIANIAILGDKGLGAIATESITLDQPDKPKGLGVYWGELLKDGPMRSRYLFVISKYEIDAHHQGNWTRFVNHSKSNFNVIAIQKTCTIGKLRLPYMEYALTRNVRAGEQLLIDYGPDYEFDAKQQIFLNPSNGVFSFVDVFTQYRDHYSLADGNLLMTCQQLLPGAAKIFVPKWWNPLLTKKGQQALKAMNFPELPLLTADRAQRIQPDKNQAGMTTLMLAAYLGDTKRFHVLLKNNANIEQQTIYQGFNALFYTIASTAKWSAKKSILESLLQRNISLLTQSNHGFTVLHWCVKVGDLKSLQFLCAYRKTKSELMEAMELENQDKLCPITYAISCGDVEMTAYLLSVYQTYYQCSLLHAKQNDWLIPTFKLIFKKYPFAKKEDMLTLLLKKGLRKNPRLLKVLRVLGK